MCIRCSTRGPTLGEGLAERGEGMGCREQGVGGEEGFPELRCSFLWSGGQWEEGGSAGGLREGGWGGGQWEGGQAGGQLGEGPGYWKVRGYAQGCG